MVDAYFSNTLSLHVSRILTNRRWQPYAGTAAVNKVTCSFDAVINLSPTSYRSSNSFFYSRHTHLGSCFNRHKLQNRRDRGGVVTLRRASATAPCAPLLTGIHAQLLVSGHQLVLADLLLFEVLLQALAYERWQLIHLFYRQR